MPLRPVAWRCLIKLMVVHFFLIAFYSYVFFRALSLWQFWRCCSSSKRPMAIWKTPTAAKRTATSHSIRSAAPTTQARRKCSRTSAYSSRRIAYTKRVRRTFRSDFTNNLLINSLHATQISSERRTEPVREDVVREIIHHVRKPVCLSVASQSITWQSMRSSDEICTLI